jgi:hypothetical protein
MHEFAALLATLKHIAGEPCSSEERSARAALLVKTYSATLYERLGIAPAARPSSRAKSAADQTLAALRRRILAAETRSSEPGRTAFTAARHWIEMARRVLAARLVETDAPAAGSPDRTQAETQTNAWHPALPPDRQILASLRRSATWRDHVVSSRAAIADSRRLLAACAGERSA